MGYMIILVGGWKPTPLKHDEVRQLDDDIPN